MTKRNVTIIGIVIIAAIAVVLSVCFWQNQPQSQAPNQQQAVAKEKTANTRAKAIEQIRNAKSVKSFAQAKETDVNSTKQEIALASARPKRFSADIQSQPGQLTEEESLAMETADSNQVFALTLDPDSRSFGIWDVNQIAQIPLTAEQQRYQERLKLIENELKPPYTQEQIEGAHRKMVESLPPKTREIYNKLDEMKKAELKKRQMAAMQRRLQQPAGTSSGYISKPNSAINVRKPSFSNNSGELIDDDK